MTVAPLDKFSDVLKRAAHLDPTIAPVFDCQMGDIYAAASHQLSRARVAVHRDGDPRTGRCNETTWFAPDHATFPGHECLSGLLTTDGNRSPSSEVVGWLQVHRGVVIWLGWDHLSVSIDWSDVLCLGSVLAGRDQDGGHWTMRFDAWYAGVVQPWPGWLLPGSAGV